MMLLLLVFLQLFVTIIKGETNSAEGTTKVLSRQRRYLVFPEGSSLQMGKSETNPKIEEFFFVDGNLKQNEV